MKKQTYYEVKYVDNKFSVESVKFDNGKFTNSNTPHPKGVTHLFDGLNFTTDFSFRIIFHFTDIFFEDAYDFGQKPYISLTENQKTFRGDLFPTIHFLMIRHGEKPRQRYYNVMDSSIWNYLVNMGETEENFDYVKRFQDCVQAIAKNTEDGLYNLDKAKEFVEFNARLVIASHLAGSSHTNHVAPFIFHSERKSLQDQSRSSQIDIDHLKGKKWRFLLVDDHASKSLTDKDGGKTKADILRLRIEEINGFKVYISKGAKSEITVENPDDYNVLLQTAGTVQDAQKLMLDYKYDIIFLDYLLGNVEKEVDGTSIRRREYGYELLEWLIDNDKRDIEGLGPNNCLYFMFISAYTTAVHERLLSEGMSRSLKGWHIGQGACPINTPELFKYYLLKLMSHRLDKLEGNTKKITNIICDIYNPKSKSVRSNAIERFNDVVNARNSVMDLRRDLGDDFDLRKPTYRPETSGSLLVESMVKQNIVLAIPGFWEHLMHLVYITAFGTYRQWNEMWEEYMYIRDMLEKLGPEKGNDKNDKSDKKKQIKQGVRAAKAIEDYLLTIRKNN